VFHANTRHGNEVSGLKEALASSLSPSASRSTRRRLIHDVNEADPLAFSPNSQTCERRTVDRLLLARPR
jgi:hypothetical protein